MGRGVEKVAAVAEAARAVDGAVAKTGVAILPHLVAAEVAVDREKKMEVARQARAKHRPRKRRKKLLKKVVAQAREAEVRVATHPERCSLLVSR